MSNYPPGAANDSRAPFNQPTITPEKVEVVVYKASTQFAGCENNFIVYGSEPHDVGFGETLGKAIENFEDMYACRYDRECKAVVKETIVTE